MQEEIVFEAHSPKQEDVIFSEHLITVAGTGVQWGKTLSGALWFKRQLHTYTNRDDNFVICAPNYKILKQSTLPHFLKVMEGYGRYKSQEDVFEMFNGGRVYCRTNTHPDSIVGIPNVRAIWGDEAGKFSLYFWENMQGRQSTNNCPIMLTTSPYTYNWIYKDLIKPKREGKRSDVGLIQAASWENPYNSLHDPEVRAQKKATMDPRRFQMLFGGEWGKMHGLVYDCWDEDLNIVEPFQLPIGTRYFGGIDWGYTDPFVFVVRAITPEGNEYGVSEFYKAGLTLPDQIKIVERATKIYPIERIFCGTDQPGSIEEFNRNKLPAEPADTTKGTIRRGIDLTYELIKTRRYKEFKGAMPYAADERATYHYPEPEDIGPDDSTEEQNPVGASDHAMDAIRYITLGTRHVFKEKAIKLPQSTNPFDAILKKKKHKNAETWS
jgi:PBSX family phage terminase large subunit